MKPFENAKSLGKAGIIARFKPLHNGAKLMLEYTCKNADYVLIGIGSVNKYNMRNPFTFEETKDMLETQGYLQNVPHNIIQLYDSGHIPEFRDGKKWKLQIEEKFRGIDNIVTANPYVTKLLEDKFKIVHPSTLIPKDEWQYIKATQVRVEMARNHNWQALVPEKVADYIMKNKLDDRFRKEFGLEVLANTLGKEYWKHENVEDEMKNVRTPYVVDKNNIASDKNELHTMS
ncbi:MAG: hypothetical protein WC755_06225 [Candidatus Woesearchaeota archaeon]|jgi:nicotinamide mononucleotide adenylyltransferase